MVLGKLEKGDIFSIQDRGLIEDIPLRLLMGCLFERVKEGGKIVGPLPGGFVPKAYRIGEVIALPDNHPVIHHQRVTLDLGAK